MAAKFPEPEAWIGNNPSIVDLMTSDLICLPSVMSSEIGIRILINGSLLSERFRESFGTFSILHVWSGWVVGTTGGVNHTRLDQLKQLWLQLVIRKFSRKKSVDVFRSAELTVMMQEDDHMNVRKSMLLKLVSEDMCDCSTKVSIFEKICFELLDLCMKDADH